ncbi:AraC family transcriptional regulator [Amycolatopsis aidingensis]|uniref:AraC family transcriptional regulator n=1 Tax=Amycolatopsis aidingensis TaxID=2842453 RepID=UPI001C0BBB7B|nr:AraC family transcriptional regulator [Amycolatopsis aidingensis]
MTVQRDRSAPPGEEPRPGTVPAHYVEAALLGARRRGLDVAELLARAGISPVLATARAVVSVQQFTAVVRVLIEALDDEFLGRARQPVPRGAFAVMCQSAVHAEHLAGALARMCRFYRLLPGTPELRLVRDQREARFECAVDPAADPDRFLSESVLRLACHFSGWLIGGRARLRGVELPYPAPEHAGDYPLTFGCPIRFDAEGPALVFEPGSLEAPVVQDERALRGLLLGSPSELVYGRADTGASVADQVRRILERSLGGEVATPAEVAARLRISQQTLRRRLARERTSFADIRAELFRDVAISMLTAGKGSVSSLAERLGFSEPSAFRRAFKRWTGATPSSFHPGKRAAPAGRC